MDLRKILNEEDQHPLPQASQGQQTIDLVGLEDPFLRKLRLNNHLHQVLENVTQGEDITHIIACLRNIKKCTGFLSPRTIKTVRSLAESKSIEDALMLLEELIVLQKQLPGITYEENITANMLLDRYETIGRVGDAFDIETAIRTAYDEFGFVSSSFNQLSRRFIELYEKTGRVDKANAVLDALESPNKNEVDNLIKDLCRGA